jgi:hypothetical protein
MCLQAKQNPDIKCSTLNWNAQTLTHDTEIAVSTALNCCHVEQLSDKVMSLPNHYALYYEKMLYQRLLILSYSMELVLTDSL